MTRTRSDREAECRKNDLMPRFDWAVNADAYAEACRREGYEPNKQLYDMMKADETDGVWNQYYKTIADKVVYKPVFDKEGNLVGETASRHNKIKADFSMDKKTTDMLFEGEGSMLEHREKSIRHNNEMMDEMSYKAVRFLNGQIGEEELMSSHPEKFDKDYNAHKYFDSEGVDYSVKSLSPQELALRNGLIDHMQKYGMDFITDIEGAQRVLDEANGKVRLSAKRRALETASLSREEKDQPTVVSSADGAKVLKSLDEAKEKYDNNSNRSKTFLGDLAKAIGAERHGSLSQYASFEAVNGSIVTIRLSNHNAKVSNFDNRDEAEGISIVVSPKKSEGITNDGDAHVMEYYYDALKLRKSDGSPLASIVESLKQSLYSGEFKDKTGLAEVQEVNGNDIETTRPKFFRTADGEAYGFTVGGKIYVDPRIADSETPIHEYGHLWATAVRASDPEKWGNIVDVMKASTAWDEAKKLYPELKSDDDIADEAVNMYSGRRGAERLRQMQEEIAKGDGTATEKAKAIGAINRLKQVLSDFWKGVAKTFGFSKEYRNADEIADAIMSDLLEGVDPRKVATDDRLREQFVGDDHDVDFSKKSMNARSRDDMWGRIDEVMMNINPNVDGKQLREERARKLEEIADERKDLYESVLSGNFDDVTLQKINNYLDNVSPNNRYWRPLSQRIPQEVERRVLQGERTGAVDALFSRICESSEPKNGRAGAEAGRRIKAKKEELLKKWAIATGNWHESVADFVDDTTPIGSGRDSTVYMSKDGKHVVKVSKGKYDGKFPPDLDQVALFNYVFPQCYYSILGYGEENGKFVRYLEQPFADFSEAEPLTVDERVEYMRDMGFGPINKEKTAFSNGEIVASDLQKNNIVRDGGGNVRVIDADMKLHLKEYGGEYDYLPVEADTTPNMWPRDNDYLSRGKMRNKMSAQGERAVEDGEVDFSKKVFGGNSGYVGYSISKRGARAKEEGRFPKGEFRKEYDVTAKAFDALVDLGVIDDSEWHHTSMYGNRTTFYGWDEDALDIYQANKKEIDSLARDVAKAREFEKKNKFRKIFYFDMRSGDVNDIIENDYKLKAMDEGTYEELRNVENLRETEGYRKFYEEEMALRAEMDELKKKAAEAKKRIEEIFDGDDDEPQFSKKTASKEDIESYDKEHGTEFTNITTAFSRDLSRILGSETESLLYPEEQKLRQMTEQSSSGHNPQIYEQSSANDGAKVENISETAKSEEIDFSVKTPGVERKYQNGVPLKLEGETMADYVGVLSRSLSRNMGNDAAKETLAKELQEAADKYTTNALRSSELRRLAGDIRVAKKGNLPGLLLEVDQIVGGARVRQALGDLRKTLKTAMTKQNNQGMTVAKGVDEYTRIMFETVNKATDGLLKSGIEAEMGDIRRDIWYTNKDLKEAKAALEGAESAEDIAEWQGKVKELEQRKSELKQQLADKKVESKKVIAEKLAMRDDIIDDELRKLDEKYSNAMDGDGVWTESDMARYTGLTLMKPLANEYDRSRHVEDLYEQIDELEKDKKMAKGKVIYSRKKK